MFLIASVLCPVLWYLWVQAGSANANFFFAITLTYALAQVDVAEPVYGDMTMNVAHTAHNTLHTTHCTLYTTHCAGVSGVGCDVLLSGA